jgi:hypothetical protein
MRIDMQCSFCGITWTDLYVNAYVYFMLVDVAADFVTTVSVYECVYVSVACMCIALCTTVMACRAVLCACEIEYAYIYIYIYTW